MEKFKLFITEQLKNAPEAEVKCGLGSKILIMHPVQATILR